MSMKFFKRIFNKTFTSKKYKSAKIQKSILTLKEQEAILIEKQEYHEKIAAEKSDLVKKHAATNKRMAFQALSQKKQHEKQMESIMNSLHMIRERIFALKNRTMNSDDLFAMKTTNKILNSSQNTMDSEKNKASAITSIDDIYEQEMIEDEISAAFLSFDGQVSIVDLLENLEQDDYMKKKEYKVVG